MRLRISAALAALAVGLFIGCSDNSSGPVAPSPTGRGGGIMPTTESPGVSLLENFSAKQVLPTSNWWNLDISKAPLDTKSASFITWIGTTQQLHPDMAPPPYGIPYIGVSGTQTLSQVTFLGYAHESDAGVPGGPIGYPIPEQAKVQPNYIENAVAGGNTSGDRHMLIIDRDKWILYELYGTHWTGSRWEANSGAVFDLKSNYRRPEGWTSTDASGLAVFPGLVRYDETVDTAPITHAFRVALKGTNGHVWPASHTASASTGAPPLGTRLRLKASKDISGYPANVRRIFQAMKTYGLIVADNGGNMMVTGTMDPRWDNSVLNPAFHSLHASDFEIIQLGWGKTTTTGVMSTFTPH
jgi:hypothetical protein